MGADDELVFLWGENPDADAAACAVAEDDEPPEQGYWTTTLLFSLQKKNTKKRIEDYLKLSTFHLK